MEELLDREKHCRLNGDAEGSTEVLKALVDTSQTDGDTIRALKLMGRKKGQVKEAFTAMLLHAYEKKKEECGINICDNSFMTPVDISLTAQIQKLPEGSPGQAEGRRRLLVFLQDVLASVVEGKIYLEKVRILFSDALKQLLLLEGRVEEALDAVYLVNIETFSSVSVEEVLLYQLDQMYLSIISGDSEKASTISKRISSRHLDEVPRLKPLFFVRQGLVFQQQRSFEKVAEVCDSLRALDEDSHRTSSAYPGLAIFYAVLDLHSEAARKALKRNSQSKLCPDPSRMYARMFMEPKLLRDSEIRKVVSEQPPEIQSLHKVYAEILGRRVLEKNVLVISTYYSRTSISGIVEVLGVPEISCTAVISEMIQSRLLKGSLDQTNGTVTFQVEEKDLEEWGTSVDRCLDLVIKITHGISKETQS